MATLAKNLTYEEWLQMPTVQDGREEVVNGELLTVPPPHLPHADIVRRLMLGLARQIDPKQVKLYGSEFGLIIRREPLTSRSPDLALFWRAKMSTAEGMVWSAPELVIEVISKSETKRRKEEKLADYSKIGVPEAWLVSPEAEHVSIYLLRDGSLTLSSIVAQGALHPTQFPGLSVSVTGIFEYE
jgi:Uma2 family endonuclease